MRAGAEKNRLQAFRWQGAVIALEDEFAKDTVEECARLGDGWGCVTGIGGMWSG